MERRKTAHTPVGGAHSFIGTHVGVRPARPRGAPGEERQPQPVRRKYFWGIDPEPDMVLVDRLVYGEYPRPGVATHADMRAAMHKMISLGYTPIRAGRQLGMSDRQAERVARKMKEAT